MPLESLRPDVPPSVNRISIESPKRENRSPEALHKYLRSSGLFDKKKRKWNRCLNEKSPFQSMESLTSVNAELADVLVVACFNQKKAKRMFEALKNDSKIFNQDNGMWQWLNIPDDYNIDDQFLAVLIEQGLDPNAAQEHWNKLKETKFYNVDLDTWNDNLSGDEVRQHDMTGKILLGLLVEAGFDSESAKKKYEALKSSGRYDDDLMQWDKTDFTDRPGVHVQRFAKDQLISILLENKFNPAGAHRQYEALKKTPLYDKRTGLWKAEMHDNQKIPDMSHAKENGSLTQLLGVIVEHEVSKIETFNDEAPQIPKRIDYIA